MLNMKEFDKSLKITWIRKLLTTNPDWEEFAIYYKIDRLTLTDINYHKQIKNSIKNPFWKDVATAYTEWYASFKTVTEISTEFQPIWGNPTLNLPFNPTWYKGGIHHLKDMYKEDGNLLEKHELERLLQTGVYFTQYYAFRYSLPREWANEMTNYRKKILLEKPPQIEWLTKDKKGGQNIRKIWNLENRSSPPYVNKDGKKN